MPFRAWTVEHKPLRNAIHEVVKPPHPIVTIAHLCYRRKSRSPGRPPTANAKASPQAGRPYHSLVGGTGEAASSVHFRTDISGPVHSGCRCSASPPFLLRSACGRPAIRQLAWQQKTTGRAAAFSGVRNSLAMEQPGTDSMQPGTHCVDLPDLPGFGGSARVLPKPLRQPDRVPLMSQWRNEQDAQTG